EDLGYGLLANPAAAKRNVGVFEDEVDRLTGRIQHSEVTGARHVRKMAFWKQCREVRAVTAWDEGILPALDDVHGNATVAERHGQANRPAHGLLGTGHRRDAAEKGAGDDALGKLVGACENVRPSTGESEDAEAVDVESIRNLAQIVRKLLQLAVRVRGRISN